MRPYHLDINLIDGGGSADIMEYHRPSKVSIRSAAEVADRSLLIFLVVAFNLRNVIGGFETFCVGSCHNGAAKLLLKFVSCNLGNMSATFGDCLVLLEGRWILLLGEFCGCNFGESVECALHSGHVVTQILFL